MAKLWQLWSKKKEDKRVNTGKYTISTLSLEDRENIIALRVDGLTPSQIAEELQLGVEQVCKVIQLERTKAQRKSNSDDMGIYNPLQAAKNDLEAMRLEIEAEKLKLKREELQMQLEEMKGDTEEDGEEEADHQDPMQTMIMSYLSTLQGGRTSPNSPSLSPLNTSQQLLSPLQAQTQESQIDLSDDEINGIIDQYSNNIKRFRKLPDSVILKFISSKFPEISERSRIRALELMKKRE